MNNVNSIKDTSDSIRQANEDKYSMSRKQVTMYNLLPLAKIGNFWQLSVTVKKAT